MFLIIFWSIGSMFGSSIQYRIRIKSIYNFPFVFEFFYIHETAWMERNISKRNVTQGSWCCQSMCLLDFRWSKYPYSTTRPLISHLCFTWLAVVVTFTCLILAQKKCFLTSHYTLIFYSLCSTMTTFRYQVHIHLKFLNICYSRYLPTKLVVEHLVDLNSRNTILLQIR